MPRDSLVPCSVYGFLGAPEHQISVSGIRGHKVSQPNPEIERERGTEEPRVRCSISQSWTVKYIVNRWNYLFIDGVNTCPNDVPTVHESSKVSQHDKSMECQGNASQMRVENVETD